MGRNRTNKKRSPSQASEEGILPATSSKRRILPQVEVRIYRAPSPVIRLDSSPITPRCLASGPTRSGSPISSVDASTPESSEFSQESRHQHRYSTRSRMPALTRSTRDIASDLIRTMSPELGDPIFHTPYERRVNRSKLTPEIVSALHFIHRQDVAHFHRLDIDAVSTPDLGRLDINSVHSLGYPSTHNDQHDSPKGNNIISTPDPDEQAHTSQPSTTLDGIPSAIWFWGRVRGHARYPNFDEDRFRRVCREYVENTRHDLSDDKSIVKPERDSGDLSSNDTGLDDGNIPEASTLILEPSTKIGDPSRAGSRHRVLLESNHSAVTHVSRSTSVKPSLGPSAPRVIQANVDLPFMRALRDEDSFDNIMSRLDNASLINVAKATTLIPLSHLQRKYWNIDQAFVDCLGPHGHEFRRVLFETDALVTGPFALRFFSRLKTSQVAMDVFVPKEKSKMLIDHICHVQNFVREAYEGLSISTKQSVRDVLLSITRLAKADMKISVFCTHDVPIRALFSFVSNSSLLNIISHSNAYCLFPRETFTNSRLCYFQSHHEYDSMGVGPAAASWKWQGTHSIEYDTSTMTLSSPEFCGTRRVGDRYSWNMSFAALSIPAGPALADGSSEPPGELERHTFELASGYHSSCGACSQGRRNSGVKHSHPPAINACVVSSLALNNRYVCAPGGWFYKLSSMCDLEVNRQTNIAIQQSGLDVASMTGLEWANIREEVLTRKSSGVPFNKTSRQWYDCITPPSGWRYVDSEVVGWYEAWCSAPEQGPSKAAATRPQIVEPVSAQLSMPFGNSSNPPDSSGIRLSKRYNNDNEARDPFDEEKEYSVLKHEVVDHYTPGRLGSAIMAGHDASAGPHIKVEPADRPLTSIPIPPSRGFLRDMRDHGVAQVPPPDGEWNAGVLLGSESEDDSDGELPGGHLYEDRRQRRLRLEKEAARSGPNPFEGLSKMQRRQRVRQFEELRLLVPDLMQRSSQAGMSDRAFGKQPVR